MEACALFLGLLAVSYAVLYELRSGADLALLFLPLPFLIWAAVRFGTLGASTAISIVGFLAIWSASHGHGPFSGETPEQNALSIQIFLIVLAIPLLFLATVIEERVTGQTELRESESRFPDRGGCCARSHLDGWRRQALHFLQQAVVGFYGTQHGTGAWKRLG